MIQIATDFVKVELHKNKSEFEIWENQLYDNTQIEFPHRRFGRITGQELPDIIGENAEWKKYRLIPNKELHHVKLEVIETEYLKSGIIDFCIKLSLVPATSINKGKNNTPVSISSTNELIGVIERDYGINASKADVNSYEKTMNILSDKQTTNAFTNLDNKLLLFQDKLLTPEYKKETNQFMGYRYELTHFIYKFYLVDVKFGELLNCFRIERKYKRTQNLRRDIGVCKLKDILSLEKVLVANIQTLKDWDDTIVYDSTILVDRRLTKKESKILENASNAQFWLNAKKENDRKTFLDWVLTYRQLSNEFGNGFHSKIRNTILDNILKVEKELENENSKNSLNVTSWMTCNNHNMGNAEATAVSNIYNSKNEVKEIGMKRLIKKRPLIRTVMKKIKKNRINVNKQYS